ncbi:MULTISPECIES: ferritin-like domain-containing protein [unclassified Rhizobium]|uniref:ferritin-like domain-containing protein n=1 Tax=unclassified Rhizobium TaxID=2613769 RepID=UPI003D2731FA
MTHSADHFLAWLRDAHAMEVHAIALLRTQIGRIENYPELRARLEDHLVQTEAQAQALQQLLDRQPGGGSMLKNVAGRLSATAQGVTSLLSGDEVVKAAMAAYTFEHSEIATYRVLIAAADELADTEALAVFEKNLAEEVAMATWLEGHLDVVTRLYLMRDERNLQAKR